MIRNAKSLFSTYTAFTVTSENGMAGTGKFFLVKGQNKMNTFEQYTVYGGMVLPYLLTDADGRNLYGYYNQTGEIAYFDGEQFNTYHNTNLRLAMNQYYADSGVDAYSVYNDYVFTKFQSDVPTVEDGVVYISIVNYIPDESEEADDDEKEISYREEHYLATFDLNGNDHRWHFSRIADLPEGLRKNGNQYSLVQAVCNGKFFLIGDPGTEGSTDSSLPFYSYNPESDEWMQEPSLPYISECVDVAASNGKLYVMFGFDPDKTKPNEERILSSVWCFDGEKWEQKNDDLKYVGRINENNGTLYHSDAITPVKNGLIFIDASVDGGGNLFLYNTETDAIEPLYYSNRLSLCDAKDERHSCVTTRDGIYYLCDYIEENETYGGWALYLIPADSGVYENPFTEDILGDADGDGEVTIDDATLVQKAAIDLVYFNRRQKTVADVNKDGRISVLDVTAIQRYLAEMDAPEGIGKPIT